MTRVCAWCDTVMGHTNTAPGEVTHGICDGCAAIVRGEARGRPPMHTCPAAAAWIEPTDCAQRKRTQPLKCRPCWRNGRAGGTGERPVAPTSPLRPA